MSGERDEFLIQWDGTDDDPGFIHEVCPGCGDGDKVPATGSWVCPVCDAEWGDEDEYDEEAP